MSLLYLVHKNIVLKFSDAAKTQYNPEASYAFRLTAVDGMGFLQVQELSVIGEDAPEPASEAFWINKDLVREIHDFDLIKDKSTLTYTGKIVVEKVAPVPADGAPQPAKAKIPSKRTVLKPKPILG